MGEQHATQVVIIPVGDIRTATFHRYARSVSHFSQIDVGRLDVASVHQCMKVFCDAEGSVDPVRRLGRLVLRYKHQYGGNATPSSSKWGDLQR